MSNICSNVMVVYGPAADVKNFGEIVKRAHAAEGFFLTELFKLCDYGVKPDNQAYSVDIDYAPDHIKFYFDTSWTPIYEDIDAFLAAKFPTLKQVTLADEFGCGLHVNTDADRRYFKWNYAVSYEREDFGGGDECFETLDDAEAFFHEQFGADVPFSTSYSSENGYNYFNVYDYEAM